jgi:GNAT superfamily N-acetyltransferase
MPATAETIPPSSVVHPITVRNATQEDAATIVRMIRALAVHQGVGDRVHASVEALRRDGFGPQPRFEAIIAERDGAPVGLAMFQSQYAVWEGAPVLQITDLYVDEAVRGTGVGFRLVFEVATIASGRGCTSLQLNMVHANPSRNSLDRIGFVHQDDLLHYRLDAAGLKSFVERGR